jgi:hypothetical protein
MTDLLMGVVACAWVTAVGLLSYRAGLRRGLALAVEGVDLAGEGWDFGGVSGDGSDGDDVSDSDGGEEGA